MILSGPAPMEQEVEVEVDRGLLLVPRPAAASPVVWASPAFLFRLVLSLALLVFPCPAVADRVSSSLSTTHHVPPLPQQAWYCAHCHQPDALSYTWGPW
ncbi:neurexin-2-beta isoform X8 [Lates japonicus]|uniref:Neurexin-2-beta isoform X8 n=1 Tax=Lates japonicus TaxID=270547 RepID=A0AAD3MYF4_LATJO|nr:neurexin-2-beta isoform X8 [Lates japonicus]